MGAASRPSECINNRHLSVLPLGAVKLYLDLGGIDCPASARRIQIIVGVGGICNSAPISLPICDWPDYLTPTPPHGEGA